MKKAIVLILSGGLDSSILLAKLLNEGHRVRALSINYGQRHVVELEAALAICQEYGVEHQVADLSSLRPLLAGSSQTDDKVPVPHGHYEAENMKLTVVPNRNALMLSVAFAWAISTKADAVAYAAHAGDHAIYPDCRESFTTPFAEAMLNADWHRVQLLRPFINLTKADIVREGARLGARTIFELSYSCYEGKHVHCGICGTCTERRMAFIEAGISDPTTYAAALAPEYVQEAKTKNLAFARKQVS